MTNRKVRIIRAWQFYRVGQVLEPMSAITRNWLIEHKFAELIDESKPIETTALDSAPEKAVQPQPVRRKRGRPRKHPIKQGT